MTHSARWQSPRLQSIRLYPSLAMVLVTVVTTVAQVPAKKTLKPCAFQVVNTESCFVEFDREAQIVPPTIQISRRKTVEIRVKNVRPVEQVSVEPQAVTLVVPSEPFQTVFQAFLPSLKSVVFVQTTGFNRSPCEQFSSVSPFREIAKLLTDQTKADEDATKFKTNLEVLNAELLEPQAAPLANRTALRTPDPRAEGKFPDWKKKMFDELASASRTPNPASVIGATGDSLHKRLLDAEKSTPPPEQKSCYSESLRVATESDEVLGLKYKWIADTQTTLAQTAQLIAQLSDAPKTATSKEAQDPDPKNFMYRKATFAIISTNQLSKTPTPKTLAVITVVFGSSRVEAFSGAVFSTLAGRSFQTSPVYVSGNKTNTSITQTITRPTIIPFASANYRLWESPRRVALFATGGIGVNPYSTSADFFFGFSVSYRSFVLSPLLDYGRDLRLTQGLYVNELLGVNGSSPTTERYWRPAFGIGISVRLSNLIGGGSAGGGN